MISAFLTTRWSTKRSGTVSTKRWTWTGYRRSCPGSNGARSGRGQSTPAEPSPFCHEILNANPYAFLDDAPLEERRARAVQLRRTLGTDVGEIGALDATAISTVADESWPVVRGRR